MTDDKTIRCGRCTVQHVVAPKPRQATANRCADCGRPFWHVLRGNKAVMGIDPKDLEHWGVEESAA